MAFSKGEFIELVKKANHVHWSAEKSSLVPLIDLLPESGLLNEKQQIAVQQQIWPVGDDPNWRQKKEKYRKALVYLIVELFGMSEALATRVVVKKGEQKIKWEKRLLTRDWEFTHTTPTANLVALDPHASREFCYPSDGLWHKFSSNEFVFCLPKLDQTRHQQKKQTTFGGHTLAFTIPLGTPYYSNVDVSLASGEIAFYHKLLLNGGRATPMLPV